MPNMTDDDGEKRFMDISGTNGYIVNGSEKENGKQHKDEKTKSERGMCKYSNLFLRVFNK